MKPTVVYFALWCLGLSMIHAQTTQKVVDQKGTIKEVDNSKWSQSGNNISNKNTGNVGIGTSSPQGALDIQSTVGTLVPPRMNNTQRNALVFPPSGGIIFNTEATQIQINVGTPNLPLWTGLAQASTTLNTVQIRTASGEVNNVKKGTFISLSALLFDNTGGFVTYDSNTRIFTLKANKVYQLEFSVNWIRTQSTFARFRWKNITTNTYIGIPQHVEVVKSDQNVAAGGLALAIISPTVDTQIAIVYAGGNTDIERLGEHADSEDCYPSVKITILQ